MSVSVNCSNKIKFSFGANYAGFRSDNYIYIIMPVACTFVASYLHGFTAFVMYRTWENFGEFGEQLAIRQNFPHQYL